MNQRIKIAVQSVKSEDIPVIKDNIMICLSLGNIQWRVLTNSEGVRKKIFEYLSLKHINYVQKIKLTYVIAVTSLSIIHLHQP